MTAVALVAVVACRPAGAEPARRDAAERPAGWTQLAPIAAAAAAAAQAEGVTIDAVDAWGEPALGCYAVWLALHGGTTGAPALADQVLGSFRDAARTRDGAERTRVGAAAAAGSQAAISLDEVVKPSEPEGMLAFSFARSPYRGRVRAQLGGGRVTAVACFGNQREPAVCEATCTRVLQGTAQGAP